MFHNLWFVWNENVPVRLPLVIQVQLECVWQHDRRGCYELAGIIANIAVTDVAQFFVLNERTSAPQILFLVIVA